MNAYRTILKLTPSGTQIGLNHPILTIGSCFADTIGSKLAKYKFDVLTNPFGILFNPHSIHKALRVALSPSPSVSPEHFIENNGIFVHYDFHSEFSALTTEALRSQLEKTIAATNTHLQKTKWLIITYGTAWVYSLNASQQIVANCHKMPAGLFTKTLLTEKNITDSFEDLYNHIQKLNADINILLTVSPVRHLKDTLELNAVSKAVLRLACHSLSQRHPRVHYFPAYEMMLDDLRDYRFYGADMIHPSPVAETYIWDQFIAGYLNEKTQAFVRDWKQILNDLEHRPFHPESKAHQQFLKKLENRIEAHASTVNVAQELRIIRNQLINKED